jgi:hypothetical protein
MLTFEAALSVLKTCGISPLGPGDSWPRHYLADPGPPWCIFVYGPTRGVSIDASTSASMGELLRESGVDPLLAFSAVAEALGK